VNAHRVSVDLSVGWWGGSADQLEAEILEALEGVGGQRDGETLTVHLDGTAQRRLRREAQMIRNRALVASNGLTMDRAASQVRDVHRYVLRTRSGINHSKSVAHIA
jgi:hypothetical protein